MEHQNQPIEQSHEKEEQEQEQMALSKISPTAPTTFHPFPRLPQELRLKTWKHALRIGRKITFDETKYPPPAILHTNSESRREALCHLTTLDLSHFLPGRRTKIFVSLDHDIFHTSQPLPSDPSDFIETLDDLVELGFAQVGFTDESWQFLLVLCAEMNVVFELKRIFEEEKDVKSVILVIDREGRRLKGLEIVWGWEWIG